MSEEDNKTTSTTYHIPKLNESNYRSWAQQLKWILDEKELLEVVEGSEKAPIAQNAPSPEQQARYNAELAAWTRKAKKARSIIGSSVSESVMTYIEGMVDPSKM
jgi:hypothetical protein